MFLFRLAQELGKTVAWIECNMSAREVAEWQVFFKVQSEAMNPKAGMNADEATFYEAFIERG